MEPLAALSVVQSALRPSGPPSGDLAALFQEGRVLAGEVLQRGDGSSVLIGIGRHQVAAEAQVRLQVGQRFMLLVQHEGGQPVLRILAPQAAETSQLLQALRNLALDTSGVGKLLGRLLGALPAAPGDEAARVREQLTGHAFRPGLSGAGLASLLQRSGLFYETLLARAFGGGKTAGQAVVAAEASGDLKGLLLRLLMDSSAGPAREGVERLLAGLELEQLVNLARRQSGEGFHWSLPVADGSAWATVDLMVREEQEAGSEDQESAATRITVGVSFSGLGPVRADLLLNDKELTVRLAASRGTTLRALSERREELVQILARSGLAVRLALVPGSEGEVDLARETLDVSLLRDNHLVDVRG